MDKITVADIYKEHGFPVHIIDIQAGVPAGTTTRIMQDLPVSKVEAERVLATLSKRTQQNYSLNTVHVVIHSKTYFMDLQRLHHFRVEDIASRAHVDEEEVYTMLRFQPVDRAIAEKVLIVLSKEYGHDYTLQTVYIPLQD